MTRGLYWRLSTMMFLEYFALGATLPVLSHYLKNGLGFSAFQSGVILSMQAVAALGAPLLTTRLADRAISAERLLGVCHLAAAAAMTALYFVEDYRTFLALYLVWGLAFTPTLPLTNAVAFHHCTDARREFGIVRGIGSVGWIAVAWLFGFVWLRGGGAGIAGERLAHSLLVGAATSLILGLMMLPFPRADAVTKTPPVRTRQALQVFLQPGMLLLTFLGFSNSLLLQYYHYGMAPFMSRIGFEDRWIMPAMSLGQLPEVLGMVLLGGLLARFGLKRVMLFGTVVQLLRFVIFMIGQPALVLLAIPCHGVNIAFFYVPAFLYLDEHSTPETRASAQLAWSMIMGGLGYLIGSLLAGQVGEWASDSAGHINFVPFWLVPTVISAISLAALALFFREDNATD